MEQSINDQVDVNATQEEQAFDYQNLSLEELVSTLVKLVKSEAIQNIKNQADAIKALFYQQYNAIVSEKRSAHIEEHGSDLDFEYDNPVQREFKTIWSDYATKRKAYFEAIEKQQTKNLAERLALIEAIKTMADTEGAVNYQEFKELQDKWRAIGQIPKEKYQEVWGNYHHHVERFYDLLHLNNDLRALDFKHNLEAKQKIVAKAKDLAAHEDINYAFNELQVLHKLWKEETGPVAKEYREEIWQEFSKYTKEVHVKRDAYFNDLRAKEEVNYQEKLKAIEAIKAFDFSNNQSHTDWKKSMEAFEQLKEAFMEIGRIPKNKTNEVWSLFKEATVPFNNAKNDFYREAKREQNENLAKKKALLETAIALKDSNDFETATETYKKIQAEWKRVGFVPRKLADQLWKEFRGACNYYFDRLNTIKTEGTPEENENLAKKEAALKEVTSKEFADFNAVKSEISEWKALGNVPSKKTKIESEFAEILTTKVKGLGLDKDQELLALYQLKIMSLAAKDSRKLNDEINTVRKQIDTLTKEIKQLENNLGFVSGGKGKANPLFDMVHKSIESNQQDLDLAKQKLKVLKTI